MDLSEVLAKALNVRICRICEQEVTDLKGHICSPCLKARLSEMRTKQKRPFADKLQMAASVFWTMKRRKLLPASVSISGGKASTILAHLALKHLPRDQITFWFGDTRIEYPETYTFLRQLDKEWKLDLNWIRTPHNPWKVFLKHGIPLGGKRRDNWPAKVREKLNIGSECCRLLKHGPLDKKHKELGIKVKLLGIQAAESHQRKFYWAEYGSIYTTQKGITNVHPLALWTDEDIWEYHRRYNIPFAEVYNMGYRRNGCWPCCMDAGFKDGALWTLEKVHPRHFALLMRKGWGEIINEFKKLKLAETPRSQWRYAKELPDRRGCFSEDSE